MWRVAKSTYSSRRVTPERERGGSGNQQRNNLRRAKLLTREGAYGRQHARSHRPVSTQCVKQ